MKTREFFKQVDGAKNLCSDSMGRNVSIQANINGKYVGTIKHMDIERVGYKFNPFTGEGGLVLDLNIKL